MNPPGTTATPYVDIEDDDDRAAWLLSLINESDDDRALVTIPRPDLSSDRDAIEHSVWRAFVLVKAARPYVTANVVRARHRADGTALLILEDHGEAA